MADVSPPIAAASTTTFTDSEVHAMVSEAHRLGMKIGAHSSVAPTLRRLTASANIHVDSIEHGCQMWQIIQHLAPGSSIFSHGTSDADTRPLFWVPTLATYYTIGQGAAPGRDPSPWQHAVQSFQLYLRTRPRGLRIACGGDTGVFAHGDNALEMKVMVRLGADWREVLQWCTLGGWELLRSMRWEGEEGRRRLADVEQLREEPRFVGDNEVPFGAVRRGFAADIIATTGDLASDFETAVDSKSISFVMKGGTVYKLHGKEVRS